MTVKLGLLALVEAKPDKGADQTTKKLAPRNAGLERRGVYRQESA